jgi:hypothetical protein
VLAELLQTGSGGWQLRAGPASIMISKSALGNDVQHTYFAKDGSQSSLTVSFPSRPGLPPRKARRATSLVMTPRAVPK